MDTHRLAMLGFLLQAGMHAGFVAVNLAVFGQPGYAAAAGALAVAALLSAIALRHGWEDHAALLAWSTAAAAAIAAVRWAVAEIGTPLDLTSPLSFLLPVGHAVVAAGAWTLWRGVAANGDVLALRRIALGCAALAVVALAFAAVALAAGGIPIGSVLLVGSPGFGLAAWAGYRKSQAAALPPAPRGRPPPLGRRPSGTAPTVPARRP